MAQYFISIKVRNLICTNYFFQCVLIEVARLNIKWVKIWSLCASTGGLIKTSLSFSNEKRNYRYINLFTRRRFLKVSRFLQFHLCNDILSKRVTNKLELIY